MTTALLEVEGLAKHYPVKRGLVMAKTIGTVRAVDGVSFRLSRGETLALVGESGCGKSTTARLVLRLIEPTAGRVRFEGTDITEMTGAPLRKLRRRMQIVFQDPFASLNPRMTVGDILEEPLIVHEIGDKDARKKRVEELLGLVGLAPYHAARYPHEFSGGQRQRIGIARALAVEPALIVCDEPVSALDVSIQAQVINLLEDIQDEFNIAYIFVAHDLSVVRHISDRVAVMYLGHIMELTDRDSLYEQPLHPYTHALLSAVPVPDPDAAGKRDRILLSGDLPSPINPPTGCVFHTRCWQAQEQCRVEKPVLRELRPGHQVACHFPVEKISGTIIGPSDGEVAPILPDEVNRADTFGGSKELGGGIYKQSVEPTRAEEFDR
jgi:oligopeptide transport system ATP-binding protein